jgi:extracellular elastinolytic metalloproteinase
VDVTTISIDPSNTCGDGPTAAAGPFTVETSSNGTTWHLAASGTFTAANLGKLNPLTPTGTTGANVSFVRYTMIKAQGADEFLDSSEMEVFGAPH